MKIEFDTKFDIDDIVYGFYNGRIWKFQVKNIRAEYDKDKLTYLHRYDSVKYDVVQYPVDPTNENGVEPENNIRLTFYEYELHTLDEMKEMLQRLIDGEDKKN